RRACSPTSAAPGRTATTSAPSSRSPHRIGMGLSSATTLSDSPITRTWQRLREERRAALVGYLTAGHPSREGSLEAIRAAARTCDILEVGVPFSDPLADGPTIQAASLAALQQGMTLEATLALVAEARLEIGRAHV